MLHGDKEGRSESHSVTFDSLQPHGLYSPWNSPDQNTGVGGHSLLQWIFPTQDFNWDPLPCRWILYQLSYQGSPQRGNTHTHTHTADSLCSTAETDMTM